MTDWLTRWSSNSIGRSGRQSIYLPTPVSRLLTRMSGDRRMTKSLLIRNGRSTEAHVSFGLGQKTGRGTEGGILNA